MSKLRIQLYSNLSTLLAAGVPVLRSLQTARSAMPRRITKILTDLHARITRGETLAEAVAAWPRTFPVFDRTLIRVGEESGRLPEVLAELADWLTLARRLRGRFLSAMVLPFIVLHFGALVAPVPSLALGGMTVPEYIHTVLATLSIFYTPALAILLIVRLTPPSGLIRQALDDLVLWIPILGQAVFHYSLARFCKSFAILYSAGVPIVRSIDQSLDTVPNSRVRQRLAGSRQAVQSGQSPSEGFSRRLPAEFLALWHVGEETGDLDRSSAKLAQIETERAETWFTALSQWLPRFIYGIICLYMAYQILKNASMIFGSVTSGIQNF
jgi:type II secretory pathway component PulF